jgi:hypothetical protein
LEPFCILWFKLLDSIDARFGDFTGSHFHFYFVASIALVAGVIVFAVGRSRLRWLLLLLFLPCAYCFFMRSDLIVI